MPKHLATPAGTERDHRRHRADSDDRSSPRRQDVLPRRHANAARPSAVRPSLPGSRAARRRGLVLVLVAAGTLGPASLHMASAGSDSSLRADDTFARTVTAGWGDASVGGTYSVSVRDRASVRDGAGVLALTPAGTVTAVLRSVDVRDVAARTTLSVDRLPGGNGVYASLLLRRQADRSSYRVLSRITRDGELRLSIRRVVGGAEVVLADEVRGPVLTPGTPALVEGTVTGTSPVVLAVRATVAGRSTAAVVTATDASKARITGSGSVGVSDYLSSTSAPVNVRYLDLQAREATAQAGPAPSTTPMPSVTPTPSTTPSAKATPTVTPTPTRTPTTPAPGPSGRAARSAGAAAPGDARYAVPAGAVVVSPDGNDDAAGTAGAPLRTLARAVRVAPSGGTVVLRGGRYHENVTVTKRLTIQSHPGETVWLDGSVPVTSWRQDGGAWVHDGWKVRFDSTPCYNRGACSGDASFVFVNRAHPMAAHPDQVFVDGVAQRQVGSRSQLTAGTFFVDTGAERLYLGSDPTGRAVAASALSEALTLNAAGTTLRGVGVRRYGTALPRMGTIRMTAPDQTLENVTVVDNATTGVFVAGAARATLRQVTASRNGMIGVGGNEADGLDVVGLRAEGNNTEHFNTAPVAGGLKVTRTRGVRIADGAFADNGGTGVWLDESVYDARVVRNDITGNSSHGVSFEISAKGLFADNLVTGNARDGFKINNSAGVKIWNNTVTGNGRTIELVQDKRSGSDRSVPGHDKRQPFPDPTMTWLVGDATVANNVLGRPGRSANCVLCVEDYTGKRSAAQMDITEDGNLYLRASASAPSWLVVWSNGPGNPRVFTTLDAFVAATGQGKHSAESRAAGRAEGRGGAQPRPLPADVAAALQRPAGQAHVGVWD